MASTLDIDDALIIFFGSEQGMYSHALLAIFMVCRRPESRATLKMFQLLVLLLQLGTALAFRYKITSSPSGNTKCLKSVFAADMTIKGKLKVTADRGTIDFTVIYKV